MEVMNIYFVSLLLLAIFLSHVMSDYGIRITHNTPHDGSTSCAINLAEIEIYDSSNNLIVPYYTAFSGTLLSFSISLCFNGDTTDFCHSTDSCPSYIDAFVSTEIFKVVVYNRQDFGYRTTGSILTFFSFPNGVPTSRTDLFSTVFAVTASSYVFSIPAPTSQPTQYPTSQPSIQPSQYPTGQPLSEPSTQPSTQPTCKPSSQPSQQPSFQPVKQPSSKPSLQPSSQPTTHPSKQPYSSPTAQPSNPPTAQPTGQPTVQPTRQPSLQPSFQPTTKPTMQPTAQPSQQPTLLPSVQSSSQPTTQPSEQPHSLPTTQPSNQPTGKPTEQPTAQPSQQPSFQQTLVPSGQPSSQPTAQPSRQPSSVPFTQPTLQPTNQPTQKPSYQSTAWPTSQPSLNPTSEPTVQPTLQPSCIPSSEPSGQPTDLPSISPSVYPTSHPSLQPTIQPTSEPSCYPSCIPSSQPSIHPSLQPLTSPTTIPISTPSIQPSTTPTRCPTMIPSVEPTQQPIRYPSAKPSLQPSCQPSSSPTKNPFGQPTQTPTSKPSRLPTSQPFIQPSNQPTSQPSSRFSHLSSTVQNISSNSTKILLSEVSDAVKSLALTSGILISSALLLNTTSEESRILQTVSYSSDILRASVLVVAFPVTTSPNISAGSGSTVNRSPIAVNLPSSSARVAISIPYVVSSSTSTAQDRITGAVVSTTELSSSLFTSSALSTISRNNSNVGSEKEVSIVSPVLASAVVSVQLLVFRANNNTPSSVQFPEFEAVLNLRDTQRYHADNAILVHNCSLAVVEHVSLQCANSRVWINLTCTGEATAQVRRKCPVPRHICTVLNLEDNTIASRDYCQGTTNINGSLTCRCGGKTGLSGSNSTSASILALNGRVSVAAFSSFVAGDLDSSVSVVADRWDGQLAQKSVLVFVTFGCLWFASLLTLAVNIRRYNISEQSKIKGNKIMNEVSPIIGTNRHISDYFVQYIISSLPFTLQEHSWWWIPVQHSLISHHLYVRICWCLFGDVEVAYREYSESQFQRKVILEVTQVITSLTLSCFILAVLYDLQSPTDDGYCALQIDKDTCLYRKTALDPWTSKCNWNPMSKTSTDDSAAAILTESLYGSAINTVTIAAELKDGGNNQSECTLNTNATSGVSFIFSFIITSIFTLILAIGLDYIFRVLNASIATDKVGMKNTALVTPSTGQNDTSTIHDGSSNTKDKEELRLVEVSRQSSSSLLSKLSTTVIFITNYLMKGNDTDASRLLSPGNVSSAILCVRERWLNSLTSSSDAPNSGYPDTKVGDQLTGVYLLRLLISDQFLMLNNSNVSKARQSYRQYQRQWFLQILSREHHHESTSALKEKQQEVSELFQWSLVGLLMLMHVGALYFLLTKAAVRGVHWQNAFFRAVMWEWIVDVIVIQVIEIVLVDYCLTVFLLADDIKQAVRKISLLHVDNFSFNKNEPSTDLSIASAQHLVSTSEAMKYTSIPEATIISQYYAQRNGAADENCEFPVSIRQENLDVSVKMLLLRVLSSFSVSGMLLIVNIGLTFVIACIAYIWIIILHPSIVTPAKEMSTSEIILAIFIWLLFVLPLLLFLVYIGESIYKHTKDSQASVVNLTLANESSGQQNHNINHIYDNMSNTQYYREPLKQKVDLSSESIISNAEYRISDDRNGKNNDTNDDNHYFHENDIDDSRSEDGSSSNISFSSFHMSSMSSSYSKKSWTMSVDSEHYPDNDMDYEDEENMNRITNKG